jgi:hypothetical protein
MTDKTYLHYLMRIHGGSDLRQEFLMRFSQVMGYTEYAADDFEISEDGSGFEISHLWYGDGGENDADAYLMADDIFDFLKLAQFLRSDFTIFRDERGLRLVWGWK